jgi:hypothetical protein
MRGLLRVSEPGSRSERSGVARNMVVSLMSTALNSGLTPAAATGRFDVQRVTAVEMSAAFPG